jgi:hypothetical protein
MGLKAFLAKPFAAYAVKKITKWKNNPLQAQQKVLNHLVNSAKNTSFGKAHDFENIKSYDDFKQRVPIKDYEGLKLYFDKVVAGEKDILWPGKPIYLSKTSGTTSGTKYIPITKESIPYHIKAARDALMCYIHETGMSDFVDGKMIFLQGSPILNMQNGIPVGRLSGIVAHHVPGYLQSNRMPSFKTNCIPEWERKVDAIVKETIKEDMRLISGIPSWVQMYFEKLIKASGKKSLIEIFPNFSLFVYGGVNYGPYQSTFNKLIGKEIPSIELYPASEGFIAFQDSQKEEGLLLLLDGGIFYEFIPASQFFDEKPPRISLKDVELGVNYVLILNTNAGLWGYNIGDTVKFVSLNPYKIIVSGRIKHFTSAFGEHVIAEEVEWAIKEASAIYKAEIIEFHVAPQVNPSSGMPYHEWFVEFAEMPDEFEAFSLKLDALLQQRNSYYKDAVQGKVLRSLIITPLQRNAFNSYMDSIGKLGGQNKVPRLANDRKIADALSSYKK